VYERCAGNLGTPNTRVYTTEHHPYIQSYEPYVQLQTCSFQEECNAAASFSTNYFYIDRGALTKSTAVSSLSIVSRCWHRVPRCDTIAESTLSRMTFVRLYNFLYTLACCEIMRVIATRLFERKKFHFQIKSRNRRFYLKSQHFPASKNIFFYLDSSNCAYFISAAARRISHKE